MDRTASTDSGLIYRVFDAASGYFGDGERGAQMAAARAEFDERRGRVFEDEEMWERWTQAFVEWYVLERPYQGDALAASVLLSDDAFAVADVEPSVTAAVLLSWLRSQRILAEVIAHGEGTVGIADLSRGTRFTVREDRSLIGLSRGELFEARLVGYGGEVRFGRTFVFHPSTARAAIAQQLSRASERGTAAHDALDVLSELRIRAERYGHVAPERVYRDAAGAA